MSSGKDKMSRAKSRFSYHHFEETGAFYLGFCLPKNPLYELHCLKCEDEHKSFEKWQEKWIFQASLYKDEMN